MNRDGEDTDDEQAKVLPDPLETASPTAAPPIVVAFIVWAVEMHERDRANGLMDAPWPPVYPKQPDEPPRVAPSRARN